MGIMDPDKDKASALGAGQQVIDGILYYAAA